MEPAPKNGRDESSLPQLESLLQSLSRCEVHTNQQSAEQAAAAAKQRLLTDQLQHAQEELAAAHASRVKMCGQIGTLQQTKEHQSRQLEAYKMDLQTSRESQSMLSKKVKELEASTWTMKQNYIRTLATRMKTTAQLLQQLHLTNGTSRTTRLPENCHEWGDMAPHKRKRVAVEEEGQNELEEDGGKPECTGPGKSSCSPQLLSLRVPVEITVPEPVVAELAECPSITVPDEDKSEQDKGEQERVRAERERELEELQTKVAKLNRDYSALEDKYRALEREHATLQTASNLSAKAIEAKDEKIEVLELELELERSKPPVEAEPPKDTPAAAQGDSELQGQLKALEDNLAQMNGYADQLEMVIAQCPSCTAKLQNDTQDSLTGSKPK